MRKFTFVFAIIIFFTMAGLAQDFAFPIKDDSSLKDALNNFHEVMAELVHGPLEEGNVDPVKEKLPALKSLCKAIFATNLPTEFEANVADISRQALALKTAVINLEAGVKEGDKETIKTCFDAIHDEYRGLKGMTTALEDYISRFHDVMSPLWHEAWEEKDTDRISKGVPSMINIAAAIVKGAEAKGGDTLAAAKQLSADLLILKAACDASDKEDILAKMEVVHETYHLLGEHEE